MPNTQKIRIPPIFREFANGAEFVSVAAENVNAALVELWARFPPIKEHMTDENGELRRFANVYVNEEDIRFLNKLETPLRDGDQISIIPPYIASDTVLAAVSVANALSNPN